MYRMIIFVVADGEADKSRFLSKGFICGECSNDGNNQTPRTTLPDSD